MLRELRCMSGVGERRFQLLEMEKDMQVVMIPVASSTQKVVTTGRALTLVTPACGQQ